MRYVCLAFLSLLAMACQKGKLPGTEVGTYQVQGSLTDNTCGASALPAEDSLDFQVEIRRLTSESGLWILGDPPGTEGTLKEDGEFSFVRTTTFVATQPQSLKDVIRQESPADYWNGAVQNEAPSPGCAYTIEERVEGRLTYTDPDAGMVDAGSVATALTGTNKITLAPSPGSDCRDALVANGGPFYTFPCSASYTLTADQVP